MKKPVHLAALGIKNRTLQLASKIHWTLQFLRTSSHAQSPLYIIRV
ncbi:MAG: hypothetical protein ACO3GY_05605 [Flavobacteriaceae bacterium]